MVTVGITILSNPDGAPRRKCGPPESSEQRKFALFGKQLGRVRKINGQLDYPHVSGGSAGIPGPRGEGLASQLRKAALQFTRELSFARR
jgi:hypothetical protein